MTAGMGECPLRSLSAATIRQAPRYGQYISINFVDYSCYHPADPHIGMKPTGCTRKREEAWRTLRQLGNNAFTHSLQFAGKDDLVALVSG